MDNKKHKTFIWILILILIIIVALIIFLLSLFKPKTYDDYLFKGANVYLIEDENLDLGDYYLFKNNSDLKAKTNLSDISDQSFNKYNYLAVKISYDECSETNLLPHHYIVKDNILTINFTYDGLCGVCAPKYVYYVLEIDKQIEFSDVDIEYTQSNKIECPMDVAYKPIIYLYPEEKTNVTIKLGNSNYLTTTYPKYENEWNVIAYPSGKLVDRNGREYYGLYWEGNNYNETMTDVGFVVKGEDTISFLEEKLSILGLNEREADEFIIYWLPKLEKNNYNYIRFASLEEINKYMPLDVNPKPDSIIRVMMLYKPLNEKIDIKEQNLVTPERKGYVLVEWGGSLIK